MPIDLTKELQQSYINRLGTIDNKLANSYKKTFDEIQKQIGDVYLKLGKNPSMSEIVKFNRLSAIEKQLQDSIKTLDGETKALLGSELSYIAKGSYKSTLEAVEKSGLGFNFIDTEINPDGLKRFLGDTLWSDAMTNNTAKLWSDTKREFETVLRANSREEIISGVMQGKSYSAVTKSLQERFDVSKSRAKTIAFTEMHKAHSYGRVEGINIAMENARELGVKAKKVWRHNHVGKPRPDHLDADGTSADPETGLFNVGGEELEAPGLGSDPSNNINCHCSAEFEVIEDLDINKKDDEQQTQEEIKVEDNIELGKGKSFEEAYDDGSLDLSFQDKDSYIQMAMDRGVLEQDSVSVNFWGDIKEDVTRLFGKNFSYGDLEDMYSTETIKTKFKQIVFANGDAHIEGTLFDRLTNKKVGSFYRVFEKYGDTKIVHNEMMFLDKEFQGKGILKELTKKNLKYFDAIGVDEISLIANGDVGSYAWSKYGFDFKNEDILENMKTKFKQYCDDLNVSAKDIKKIDKMKHSWDFALFEAERVTLEGEKIMMSGKDFLLKNDSWLGKLSLSKNSLERKILENYIGY